VSPTGMIPTAAGPVLPTAAMGRGGGGLGAGSAGSAGAPHIIRATAGPHMMSAAMMPVASIAPPPGGAPAAALGAAPPAGGLHIQQQHSPGSPGHTTTGPRSPAGTPAAATAGQGGGIQGMMSGAGDMSVGVLTPTQAPHSDTGAAGVLRPGSTPGPQLAPAQQHSLLSPVTPPMLSEKQPLQQPDSSDRGR
jgi:hypothetical protein